MSLQTFEVRIKFIAFSTSKERLEQEIKMFLEEELDVCLEPDIARWKIVLKFIILNFLH